MQYVCNSDLYVYIHAYHIFNHVQQDAYIYILYIYIYQCNMYSVRIRCHQQKGPRIWYQPLQNVWPPGWTTPPAPVGRSRGEGMTKVKEVTTSSSRERFDHPNGGHLTPDWKGHGKKHPPKVIKGPVVKLKNFNIFQVQSMMFQGPKMDM